MCPGRTLYKWLRGVDLNHRPLGYEPKKIRNFNNLQDAGGSQNPCKERSGSVIGQLMDRGSVLRYSWRCGPSKKLALFRITTQWRATLPFVRARSTELFWEAPKDFVRE